MALLTVKDLSVGYGNQIVAENINFEVNAGDYLCIVGENGSGKSTLMKTLLRLQKPVKGEILTGEGLTENEIGYLPQQTVIQKDFPASVREVVLSGCQSRGGFRPFYSSEDKKTAAENMEKMGITDLAGRCYRELSGGQQQRVLLARALCATRKLLLLDEPVSGLDPKVTAEMYALISELNKEKVTIIMISHDIGAAMGFADHILHIGDNVFFGTKDEYLGSKAGKFFLMMQSRDAESVFASGPRKTMKKEEETNG
ncbi:MAG: metal ABC transporter ATP-binding protein [Lachnospiraceae bacterium]|nr:metal ABC transporter ATP-binding protein [Lachnospiraceae bacterium]